MAGINDLLASLDSTRRTLGKRGQDILNDPIGASQQAADQLKSILLQALDSPDKTQGLAEALLPGGFLGAIRWQGSPNYIRGNRFDMSKLGTGEGAQVVARGHYVAENPEVAKSYQTNLGSRELVRKLREVSDLEYGDDEILALLKKGVGDDSKLTAPERKFMAELRKNDYLGYDSPFDSARVMGNPKMRQSVDAPEELLKATEKLGHLYKVDIPDEAIASMLNFDQALSLQPQVVKKLQAAKINFDPEDTGRDLYKSFTGRTDKPKQSAKAVQEMFDSIGIPGVSYLDAFSRSKGGTTNNVLFNDNLARILEKNGKPTGEKPWMPGEYGYKEPTEARKDEAMQNILEFLKTNGITDL